MRSVSDQLREAIESSSMTRRDIGRAVDLDESVLCRFVHYQGGLSVSSIDKLCKFLKLELRPVRKPRAKGR